MLSRRELLAGAVAATVAPTPPLRPTPFQIRGPFWPSPGMRERRFPRDADLDLAFVAGAPPAEGLRVHLVGDVRDTRGEPVVDAVLEVWQTCSRGRYLHPGDRRRDAGLHDPGFQYFGTGPVDADGSWAVRTVMPKTYPATRSRTWWRPPHVHFRVLVGGDVLLTTQMYFDDPLDPDNETKHRAVQRVDRLLRGVEPQRRHELITPLVAAPEWPDLEATLRAQGLGWDGSGRAGRFRMIVER